MARLSKEEKQDVNTLAIGLSLLVEEIRRGLATLSSYDPKSTEAIRAMIIKRLEPDEEEKPVL